MFMVSRRQDRRVAEIKWKWKWGKCSPFVDSTRKNLLCVFYLGQRAARRSEIRSRSSLSHCRLRHQRGHPYMTSALRGLGPGG